jgi:shikimate kinase
MNITITGPRSIGKTTISKEVAKKLNLKYISSDEIGEKALKKQGGLDKAIKSGYIKNFIEKKGYVLIKSVYNKKKNYVFDLSGGSFTYQKTPNACLEVRKLAKEKSIVVGLLPSKNKIYSILFLFNRERKRTHFKDMNKLTLFRKIIKNYLNFPRIFYEWTDIIVYTQNKTPEEISDEIIDKIK